MQYGRERRDRKSEIASFWEKKKNIKVTNPVILKDTLKMKSTAAF